MTPSAIHQAIRLSKYPKEMSWICQSSAVLPEGVTELLRLCSSNEKIKEFAEKYHTDAEPLQEMLLNFVDTVLLNESNSNEKLLGINEQADTEKRKLHYQLLIKIYHPDRNTSQDAAYQTARIATAYQELKTQKTEGEFKNIRISRVPPKSFYNATMKAEQQLSSVKSAFIAMLTITVISAVWIGGYLYEPTAPELFSRSNTDTTYNNSDNDNSNPQNIETDQFAISNHATVVSIKSEQDEYQHMLTSIETAYETGDAAKIQTILNSPEIKQQSDKEVFAKLENLFKITSDRKMLLYDFEWQNISGQVSGKGRFLSRYHLKGENQWLTREGVASIIAKKSKKGVDITSLKLDNKNIDQ
ncbi:MAG: J domain-containing protein [Cocleimonas sp.]|nr:J domain-containing protein [Cocleimonas sp.]